MDIDDHELTGLDVLTAAALLNTQKGPLIGNFHEYAHLGKGRSIHAAGQMEWFSCKVHDRSKVWELPKEMKPLMDMCSCSPLNRDWFICTPSGFLLMMTLSNTLFTSLDIWDASVLDHVITPAFLDEINHEADDSLLQDSILDEFGDLQQLVALHLGVLCDSSPTETGEHTFHANLPESNPAEQDWKSLWPYFGW